MDPDGVTLRRAACIGGGVIGAGWASRLLLNGVDVTIHDPDPEAGRRVAEVLANAERAYQRMAGSARPPHGRLRFAGSIDEAVDGADLVQESVPERLDIKRRVLATVDAATPAHVLIASSTSGLLPTQMQTGLRHPQRLLVGHPFNPVYLLPLVELVAGERTSSEAIERARAIYERIGMKPVVIRKEIDAFVGDRLQEALWREALWLVHDDIATVQDIDDVIRHSFGLRWAQMGVFQTYRVAGGEAGMRHFMAQFGPALKWPWTKLMDVPELTPELVDKVAQQSDAQAGGISIRQLEQIRDDNLIAIKEALAARDGNEGWGAGAELARYKRSLASAAGAPSHDDTPAGAGLLAHRCTVAAEWIDYNGHMTEHRYVQVFGDTTDAVLARIGVDRDYVAAGFSYYTVETHVRHLGEAQVGDALAVYTRFIRVDDKRIHLFHSLFDDDAGVLLATSEQLLLHVDARAGRAVAAPARMLARLRDLAADHTAGPAPRDAGRRVGDRP